MTPSVERYTFGDREHVALRMLPCLVARSDADQLEAFLTALHPTGFHDLRALWALAPDSRPKPLKGVPATDFDAVRQFAKAHSGRFDVYIGVAARATATGRKAPDCSALYTIYADFDFKGSSEEDVRASLADFDLQPSAIIRSGGGLHVYWFLTEPYDLTNEHHQRMAKMVLESTARYLGADTGSVDVAHILRLPTTLNHKYDPPRSVVIEMLDTDVRYQPNAFAFVLADNAPDVRSKPRAEPLPEVVPDHTRNTTLMSEGGRLRRRGWEESEILVSLTKLNETRCKPPLTAKEVRTIARNVAKYKPGDPAAPPATSAAIVIHRAADVPDERLVKLFGGRLVRGAGALVAGPGEGGKGMFAMSVCSRFTTGAPFPGETQHRPPVNVLICVTEDSMGRVKSRLRAAGADLDRVYFVQGPEVTRGGLTMPSSMMLDDDAGELVKEAKIRLAEVLFLETIVEHFGDRSGKTRRSTNNEADVRAALRPFMAVCERAGLFGLGAIHPRKSTDGGVDDSISGSAAFRNVARVVQHIYRDPEDESDDPVRLLFASKSNYQSRRPPTLRFRIRSWDEERQCPCDCPVADCGHEGRVVWEEGDDLFDERSADDIWQQLAELKRVRRDVGVEEAEEFLNGLMVDGVIAMVPKQIYKLASNDGLSTATIDRAKKKLELVSVKEGFPAAVVAWKGPKF